MSIPNPLPPSRVWRGTKVGCLRWCRPKGKGTVVELIFLCQRPDGNSWPGTSLEPRTRTGQPRRERQQGASAANFGRSFGGRPGDFYGEIGYCHYGIINTGSDQRHGSGPATLAFRYLPSNTVMRSQAQPTVDYELRYKSAFQGGLPY